ncbi:hypothetical protein O3Q52_01935 [Streptomyces sp. ActVer]|uniref:hypothetical protein n=1 Tax=Streptomyces sp. ActVer TaxID=3014558 RepID=UPI0022B435AE|nr:hypothetical protein [Streptomyces sp. ActVer]MCZ4506988.1 hypothetical protein [Streptomyces sp. ActVer]
MGTADGGLAGGGAEALRGTFSSHTLHAAFASGLNTATVVAGVTGTLAGALILVLVRAPRPRRPSPLDSPIREERVPAPRP